MTKLTKRERKERNKINAMCKIITAYTLKGSEEVKGIMERVRAEIIDASVANKDGLALTAQMETGKVYGVKTIVPFTDDEIASAVNERSKAVHAHLRAATAGKVSEGNLHLWRMNGWKFAHNGYVWKFAGRSEGNKKDNTYSYCGGKDQEFTDSFLFFREACREGIITREKIDWEKMLAFAKESDLRGRFVLLNEEDQVAYYVGDWYAYLIGSSVLAFGSAPLTNLKTKKLVKVWNMTMVSNKPEVEVLENNVEGVIKVDYGRGNIEQIIEKVDLWGSRSFGYNSTGYNTSDYNRNQSNNLLPARTYHFGEHTHGDPYHRGNTCDDDSDIVMDADVPNYPRGKKGRHKNKTGNKDTHVPATV